MSPSARGWEALAAAVAWSAIATLVVLVMGPWVVQLTPTGALAWNLHTLGFHDWDVETSHRYLAVQALLKYHELPAWDPYACGGFPAWGYVEADTILVSPWLPFYLLLPMALALRVEVLGMGVLGAVGAYLLAGRFTRSHAARALVVVLWAMNGRWALQVAAGHTWHLAYAWLPWCLYFFERARQPGRTLEELAWGGVAIAMLVYSGGIYPLPHTVLVLGLYAGLLALLERRAGPGGLLARVSLRPLTTLAAMGLLGLGLSAPKLLPMMDGFAKAPRAIESTETQDLGAFFTELTSKDQAFYSRPARVSPYGWHEWGIYIGAAGVLALFLAFVLVEGRRERVLKLVGALLLLLGFGAFHKQAPWTLLHEAPVFRSQHVPARFVYPAILVLSLVAAAGLGRLLMRRAATRPWLDALAGLLVVALAFDVGSVARKPMADAMWMVPPDGIPEDRPYHVEKDPPFAYKKADWAGPMYLAMLGNVGVLNCYGTPPFDRKGAHARGEPQYKGEVYVEGEGQAKVVAWSPNHAELSVEGASPGSLLVYNMNYDEGWHARVGGAAAEVVSLRNQVAVKLPAGATRVTLAYSPPSLGLGLLTGAATVAGLAYAFQRRRRASRGDRAGRPTATPDRAPSAEGDHG